MVDMEQIWEKFFLNAFIGSSVKTIQWFNYFSCRVLFAPTENKEAPEVPALYPRL